MTLPRVELIAATRPTHMTHGSSAGEFVAHVARVSNPANQNNHQTAPRLLGYLRRNGHWSPFEMAHAVMQIDTTRDIARQLLRHRSFSFQEFSQRYAAVTDFAPPREARLQDTANRQNSLPADDAGLQKWWHAEQAELIDRVQRLYERALDKGVAKEVARAVLPEGLTMSRLYMAGTLRSWVHYIEARTAEGTQKEHRDVALAIQAELAGAFPEVFA